MTTQEDREAARPFMGDAVHYGHLDEHKLIQAFTAHRIAAEQRIVAWLRGQSETEDCERTVQQTQWFAQAIEAGEHRGE